METWSLQFMQTVWTILLESAGWVVLSLVVGGVVHEFLPTSRFQQFMNRKGLTAMSGAVLLGGLLPICSCGVIPLAVSLYRSGVRLGPVMAFAAATPIINPAAVILSLALLGPKLTLAYVLLGLTLPFLLGSLADRFGDPPVKAMPTSSQGQAADGCCQTGAQAGTTSRLGTGLRWGLFTLGPSIGFYLAIGILLGGLLSTALPSGWMEAYLGSPAVSGLLIAALAGASIYVCAVAHIPLVATLLAAGAAPGVAIVFLVTGTATNLPELITLYKTIGRRTVILYSGGLIVAAMLAGIIVNGLLLPGFAPHFDPLASLNMVESGERFWFTPWAWLNTTAAWLLIALAVWGSWLRIRQWFFRPVQVDACGCPGPREGD